MYKKLTIDLSNYNYENKVFQGFYKIHDKFNFGKTILDLGCGLGKFSIIARDLGYEVTGMDVRSPRIPFEEKNIKWKIEHI